MKTVLTDEQINDEARKLYGSLATDQEQRLARAIEQAVLKSPAVMAMRKDAERYWVLRQMNWFDSPLCVVASPQKNLKLGAFCPSVDELDKAIDAAMEKQP